ncbi:MAG: hypothetical protein JJU20_15095 [Opitutales bacterium]|nr:hypothetical protein [Opitutales bacterium]
MFSKTKFYLSIAALLSLSLANLYAQPSPQVFLNQALSNSGLQTSSGEQYAWHVNFNARYFVDAYEAYNDPAWLDAAIEYFDTAIEDGISEDPDGYPGVIGAFIRQDLSDPTVEFLYDAIVGDALIASHILRVAETIFNDPLLHAEYLAKAEEYLDLAEAMIWTKWNERSTYFVDHLGYGSYHTHPYGIRRDDPTVWEPQPNRKISENLNKQYKAAQAIMRLYRITGERKYRDRAYEIFSRAKAMFRYYPDQERIVWNFWMPHGRWDMDGSNTRSWVAVHPSMSFYQVIETEIFMEAYNTGIVFDQEDIQKMVNTNLWMRDNNWVNADGSASAGELWKDLAQVDSEIRNLYASELSGSASLRDQISLAYLENVVDERSGFNRVLVDSESEVVVHDVELQPGTQLMMALAVPSQIETVNSDRSQLVVRAVSSGSISVDLLDQDGELIGNLDSGNVSGNYYSYAWDGTHPLSEQIEHGEYIVRWTFAGEERTWPVSVVEGELREDDFSGLQIRPGQTLFYDFEDGDLDSRWLVENADISNNRSFSGEKSLRVVRNGRATLNFGDFVDLPVRIEFRVYDGGEEFGTQIQEGAFWGTRSANGDQFLLGKRWRSFLNGDDLLVWINLGLNDGWSVYNTGLERSKGQWSRWVFDYSEGLQEPVITYNGVTLDNSRVTDVGVEWLPGGAVGVAFRGPGPDVPGSEIQKAFLYVDDLKVTHTGRPETIFTQSITTEELGNYWKATGLGFFYDRHFPWVYWVEREEWVFILGFHEQDGFYLWSDKSNAWYFSKTEYYPRVLRVKDTETSN